jgi:uncharacterized protein (TIGR03437 family)
MRTHSEGHGVTLSLTRAVILCLSLAGTVWAQVQVLAVVNAASYQAGLPEPGALATIFCTGLTGISGIVTPATQLPLPRQLAGVQVAVNLGAAPLLAVADVGGGLQQINFQVPPERILASKSTVTVTQSGTSGMAGNIDYPPVGGFFSDTQGNAIAWHVLDGTLVTLGNPARAGEFLAVYGTGFGPTYPPKPIGFPAPAVPPFQGTMDFAEPGTSYNVAQPLRQLSLGPKVAQVSFAGVAPGLAGVDEIIFQVPGGLDSGTQPLTLAVGVVSCLPPPFAQSCSFQEQASSNSVKIAVQ